MSDSVAVVSGPEARRDSVAERARFVQALALRIDPAWRRLPRPERRRSAAAFAAALVPASPVRTLVYSMTGLRAGVDLLLWSLGPDLDGLEERAAAALRTGPGAWAAVGLSLTGVLAGSPYGRPRPPAEPSLFAGERARYLVVYPFSKSAEWYLLGPEARQGIMNEHIRIGRRFPEVRQLLANGFGLGDQDYVVAYETDDLGAFGDLVRALRATEGRRATVRDTPVLTAVRRSPAELVRLLSD